VKYLLLLALLYTAPAETEGIKLEWWQAGEFGSCTKTDIAERGICGDLIVKSKPDWGK
jgi:hypothetical protein